MLFRSPPPNPPIPTSVPSPGLDPGPGTSSQCPRCANMHATICRSLHPGAVQPYTQRTVGLRSVCRVPCAVEGVGAEAKGGGTHSSVDRPPNLGEGFGAAGLGARGHGMFASSTASCLNSSNPLAARWAISCRTELPRLVGGSWGRRLEGWLLFCHQVVASVWVVLPDSSPGLSDSKTGILVFSGSGAVGWVAITNFSKNPGVKSGGGFGFRVWAALR